MNIVIGEQLILKTSIYSIHKTKYSCCNHLYLFVPVGPVCNPHQDQGLDEGAPNHTTPNTLQSYMQSLYQTPE